VITGEMKSNVDRVRDAFRSDRISNPLAEKKERLTGNGDAIIVGADRQTLIWSGHIDDDPTPMGKAEVIAEKMNGAGFDAIVVTAMAV
jgi:hypothetical protein